MATIAPVEFSLRIGGVDGVAAALRDVQNRLDGMARASVKSTEQAAKARVKVEQQAAKDVARVAKDGQKEMGLVLKDSAKEFEIAETKKSTVIAQQARQRERIVQNSLRMEQRYREQAARDEINAIERVSRHREQRANRVGGIVGRSVSRGIGVVGRVAGIAASLGGGFAIADALQTGISQEAMAGQIVRSAQNTGGLKRADVLGQARAATIATGGKTTDTLGGLNEFVKKTGDLKVGVDLMKDLARYSAATGTSMSDMGSTAAEIFNVTGSQAETKSSLLALMGQGKAGAIDIRDLAQYGARITASSTLFEGGTAKNIETFGGLAQIAKKRGGAVDAAEASEAVARLFTEIATNKDKFAGVLGHSVMGKHGKMLPIEQILTETLVKTHGDITAIPKLLGRQAGKVETGLATVFNEAGGGGRGLAAVRAELAGGKLSMSEGEVSAGVANRNEEAEAKINNATEAFNKAVQEQLMPALTPLIGEFVKLIPAIGEVLAFFANHPFAGLAGVVIASISADLAAAGLGAGVKAAIVALIGGGSAASGTAGAVAAATGGGGAVTAGEVAAGAAAGAGGLTAGIAGFVAAPLALLGYLGYRAQKNTNAGELAATQALGQDESTPEAQKAKLAAIQGMIGRAEDRKTALAAFNQGQETTLTGSKKEALNDNEASGMLKKLPQLKAEFETLSKQINGASNALASLAAHGGDFGRANQNDPARAPSQVGR